jgi:hypothetical protein
MNNSEASYFLDHYNQIEIIVKSHFDEYLIELFDKQTYLNIKFLYGTKQIKELADFLYSIIGEK